MELPSGNANFWSILAIFCPLYPWNLADALNNQINQNVYFSQGTWQIHSTTFVTWQNMCPEMRTTREARLIVLVSQKQTKGNRVFAAATFVIFHLRIQIRATARKRPNWGLIFIRPLRPLPFTSDLDLLCMDITFVNGNDSWQFHDNTIIGTCKKSVAGGRTDGQKCS